VLADPALRQGVKLYSDRQTFPQFYVDGVFVGGSDVVRAMHGQNELASLLAPRLRRARAACARRSSSAWAPSAVGAALCRRLASEGYHMLIAGKTPLKIEQAGGCAAAAATDPTRQDDVLARASR